MNTGFERLELLEDALSGRGGRRGGFGAWGGIRVVFEILRERGIVLWGVGWPLRLAADGGREVMASKGRKESRGREFVWMRGDFNCNCCGQSSHLTRRLFSHRTSPFVLKCHCFRNY